MKFRLDNKYLYWGVTAFLVIAASMLFYFGIFHMNILIGGLAKILDIFMPLIYGGVIAYLVNPILNFFEKQVACPILEKHGKMPSKRVSRVIRYAGVFLSLAIMLWLVYALISMILPEMISSIVSIINNFPRYVDSITNWITHMLENNSEINSFVIGLIDRYSVRAENFLTQDILPQMQNILRQFSSGVWDIITFVKNILIGIIVSIYILADKESFRGKLTKLIYAVFSKRIADEILENIRFTDKTFGGFISGKILDSFIIGILCYIGCSILKMPYIVLVSVIIGVTNVIPFFGPYLGAVPSALLILLVSPIKCLYFVIFILVLQQFDGNILGPKILGDSTGLSSFMVILAILVGGGLFGVFGMFVGVPVCAVIYSIFWKLIDRSLLRKNMPADEENYR